MSRISYSDEEDFNGQFALWQANCARSLRGRAGQRELRALEAALLALPSKRLTAGEVESENGDVCALGAYGKHKGLDLSQFENDYDSDEIGIAGGMPRLVAWKVVELNDILLDTVWERHYGPLRRGEASYQGGVAFVRDMTPEERYERVLAWVREQLHPAGASEEPR